MFVKKKIYLFNYNKKKVHQVISFLIIHKMFMINGNGVHI